jgi:S-DNA-T family DNA segregation ATPase FtsK/SpoIIIE
LKQNAATIESVLDSFGIKARVVEVNCGPAVTQYALEISLGTKLSKITALQNDLALALAAPTGQIRIEAPIPGRSMVGIEIPNRTPEFVTLRTMLKSDALKKNKSKLAVSLGLNVSGEPVVADIASMPHLLIAGATGSGKSVALNAFLATILFRLSRPQACRAHRLQRHPPSFDTGHRRTRQGRRRPQMGNHRDERPLQALRRSRR